MTEAELPRAALEGPTWALVELMGHRQVAGRVSEAELCGKPILRVQIPGPEGAFFPQFYRPESIYSLTPTSEERVRAWAQRYEPDPASRFQLLTPMVSVSVVDGSDPPVDHVDDDDDAPDNEGAF